MTLGLGDYITKAFGWSFWKDVASGTVPTTPTLAVVDGGTGTTATATVTGGDATATHYLQYKLTSSRQWVTFGTTITGNGSATITGLTQDKWYDFRCAPKNSSGYGLPSVEVREKITDGTTDAKIIRLADLVVDELNGLGLTPSFTAEYDFLHSIDRADAVLLLVKVVPNTQAWVSLGRRDDRQTYRIDIGVKKLVAAKADIATLIKLVEDIYLHFRHTRFDSQFVCTATLNEPMYDVSKGETNREFFSRIQLTFERNG